MMQKYLLIKLIGMAVLTMITLIVISVLEVTLYSHLINPGQDMAIYDRHAENTAPYISGIFGFVIFFMVAKYWTKRRTQNLFKLVLLFPLIYVLLDILILTLAGVKWSDFIFIFTLANTAKFLGSYFGYKLSVGNF